MGRGEGAGFRRRIVAEQTADFLLDIERDLALAGLGQVDSVGTSQTDLLTVDVRAGDDELAFLIDETIPYVDELTARLLRFTPEDAVERDHIGRHRRRLEGRHADP